MRCRTLAHALKQQGAEILFLCRKQPGDLIELLEEDYRVLALPEQDLSSCGGLEGRNLYEAWLGVSQTQDAKECLRALASTGVHTVDWLVIDHYGLDASWEAQLKIGINEDSKVKLLVIDDLADRPHQADILIDQNFFGDSTNERYQKLVPEYCQQLLGPHYALLGPEYAKLQPLIPVRRQLKRLLIFFGGVDPKNLTGKALKALMHSSFEHLEVDVVLGRKSPNRKQIEKLAASRPSTTLHAPLPSLAGLIARADLAIGAGGATTWERACLKLPSLVVTIAANQRPIAEALAQRGDVHLLGDSETVSTQQIQSVMLAQIAGSFQQEQNAGGDLTDGLGVSRLVVAMLGTKTSISLFLAKKSDESLLSRWSKDLQLAADRGTSAPKVPSNFNQIKTRNLDNQEQLLLIAKTSENCPIGQIRLRRQPLNSNRRFCEIIFDASVDRCASRINLEPELVHLGLQSMEKYWGSTDKKISDTTTISTTSYTCFARAFFREETNPKQLEVSSNMEHKSEPWRPYFITLLSDANSWLNSYLPDLVIELWKRDCGVRWIHSAADLLPGDVCMMLGCGELLNAEQLKLHHHNLVVHESALPQGQGWSPMTWQILAGINDIPVTLFEAISDLDAGPIYLQKQIKLQGHELVDEWRSSQSKVTLELCLEWLDRYQEVVDAAKPQKGVRSHYRRRRQADSKMDPSLSIAEQFNLLRVVDNKRYPASFDWSGKTYKLLIAED